MNTQIGSQWDGLRHYGYDDGRFYNGLTQKQIYSGTTTKLGIQGGSKPPSMVIMSGFVRSDV